MLPQRFCHSKQKPCVAGGSKGEIAHLQSSLLGVGSGGRRPHLLLKEVHESLLPAPQKPGRDALLLGEGWKPNPSSLEKGQENLLVPGSHTSTKQRSAAAGKVLGESLLSRSTDHCETGSCCHEGGEGKSKNAERLYSKPSAPPCLRSRLDQENNPPRLLVRSRAPRQKH